MIKQGRVIWFSKHHGYGFIRIDGDGFPNAFFHHTDLKMDGYRTIKSGQRVTFELNFTRKGPVACDITLVNNNGNKL